MKSNYNDVIDLLLTIVEDEEVRKSILICGSIVPYIMEQTGMTTKEIDAALNKKSGLLGVSGVSSDSRDIEDGIKEGNEKCILAQNNYFYNNNNVV